MWEVGAGKDGSTLRRMTEIRENESTFVARPRSVVVAFWLLLAIAAVALVSSIISEFFVDWGALAATATRPRAHGAQVSQSGALALVITVHVVSYLGIVITAVLAFFVRAGYGVARLLVTVVTALSLIGIATSFSAVNVVVVVIRIVAVVLLWLPVSSEFFALSRDRRERDRLGIPAPAA